MPKEEEEPPHHHHHADPNSVVDVMEAILSSTLMRIWPTITIMALWATMITLVNKLTSAEMTVAPTLLTVLGTILGLVLSYRTSTAYDRYWEGRRLWSTLVVTSRCLARLIWIHCPDSRKPVADPKDAEDREKAIKEKRTAIYLILGFAVAVKHYLRGEEGILYEDLYHLVRYLPLYRMPSGILPNSLAYDQPPASPPTPFDPSTVSTAPAPLCALSAPPPKLLPARDPPRLHMSDLFPLRYMPWGRRKRMKRKMDQTSLAAYEKRMQMSKGRGGSHSIPLEITVYLSTYIALLQRRKTVDPSLSTQLMQQMNQMTDTLGSLERILTTPLPFSYAAHIAIVTGIYCLMLPFQIYSLFGYITIPATVVTTFILAGLVSLGQEIENPFGYDKNDLNLDYFCNQIIKIELEAIMSRPARDPEEWMFSADNPVVNPGSGKSQAQALDEEKEGLEV